MKGQKRQFASDPDAATQTALAPVLHANFHLGHNGWYI